MRIFLLIAFLACSAIASDTNLTSITSGTIETSHVNQYFNALTGDVIPHNTSGVATDEAGSLGSSTYKWLAVRIESGGWEAGDLKAHYTYNGTVYCGQGWMLANGNVINEANYDAETGHITGDWDTYIISTPLENKYLPNMGGKYLIGVATTSQTGAFAITTVGNVGHSIPVHNHTVNAHNQMWWDGESNAVDNWFDVNGSPIDMIAGGGGPSYGWGNIIATYSYMDSDNFYTTNSTPALVNMVTKDLRPESIEVQYCMRVVE